MECEIPLPKKLTKRGMTGSPAPRIRNEGLNLVPDGKTKELAGVYRSMPEFHDIELLVGGETFKAHKLVLAGASPMLYKLFTNGMKESGKSQVELLELRPTVWRAVLSFVYGENVWVPDLENAFEILESARRYQIESLENSVATKLIAAITEENCCFALVHSDKLGSTTVKERALSVVLENFHKLFCQPALSNLDIGLMEQVISSKKLHVRSELEVAHAIALWLARNGFVKMDDVAEFIPDLESQSEAAMHVSLDMSSDNVRQIKNQLSRRIIVANMTEGELKHCAVLCRSLDFDDVYEACVQNIIGQNPKAPPKGAVHRRGRREFVESDFPRINIRVRSEQLYASSDTDMFVL